MKKENKLNNVFKYSIAILGIGFIAYGIGFINTDNTKSTNEEKTSLVIKNTNISKDKNIKELQIQKQQMMSSIKKMNIQNIKKSDFIVKIGKDVGSLMQEISPDDIKTIKKQNIDPIGAVSIADNAIRDLEVGDVFELPLLGNSSYKVEVKEKTKNPSGSVTVKGKLTNNERFSVVLTQSSKTAFATVNTPDGSYEIETVNGEGYVYNVKNLDKRIDYSKEDSLNL